MLTRSIAPYIERHSLAFNRELQIEYDDYYKTVSQIRPEDVRAALTVQAFAAFEWFICSLLRASADYYDLKTDKFCDLPTAVANMNIHLSGRALSIFAEAKQHEKVNINEYCQHLGGCHTQSNSFRLNSHAFGMFMPNLNSKSLEKVMKRVGYEINWDVIGADKNLKNLVGETSKRNAGKAAKEQFDELAEKRNEIAHQGDGSVVVGDSELENYLEFLRIVSALLANELGKELLTKIKTN